jgi:predicted dehydrogenase
MENTKGQVRVGVISTAGIANKVVQTCQKSDLLVVVAVASRDELKAKEFAAKYNIPRHYGNYEVSTLGATVDTARTC